jgi:predicted porin
MTDRIDKRGEGGSWGKLALLGASALTAAGSLGAGPARAEDQPIAVSVGGDYQAAFGLIDQDSKDGELADATNTVAFGQDIEINFFGSATFDNGLTAGFKAALEGDSEGDDSETLDERFVFFRGNFGQIRLGATEDARQEFTNFAPSGASIFGVNTPSFIFADPGNAVGIASVTTYDDLLGSEDSGKVVYFSPSFGGFSFALSYAPSDRGQSQYGANGREVAGQLLDQLAAGVAFEHDLGEVAVRLSGGYSTYTLDRCGSTAGSQSCEDSPASWHAGATVTFDKVSIGGGYLDHDLVSDSITGSQRDREDFDVGIAYAEEEAWAIALQYGRVRQDGLDGLDESFDMVALNGSYALGPGVSVQAQLDFGNFEDDTPGSLDNEFIEFMVGTALSF